MIWRHACRRVVDGGTELAPVSDYDSAGVWIDSRGDPCLVLRLRYPDGTSSPRLLHERTCMGTFRGSSGGGQVAPEPAQGGAVPRGAWLTRPGEPEVAVRSSSGSSGSSADGSRDAGRGCDR